MANWYDFGTATVGAGGTTVTLSAGALALQNIRPGDGFVVKGASFPPVEILTVPTNLTFTIDAWPYAAQTSVAYTIQPGPAWSSTAAVAQDVSEYLAAISGVQNSDTTNTVGTGSKTWNVQPNLRLSVGARIRFADIAAPTTRYMDGVVTSYAGRALTVLIDRAIGSGSASAWNVNFTGEVGSIGPSTNLTIGTVTTGAAGSSASASVTGTSPSQVLNLTIPRGDAGAGSGDVTAASSFGTDNRIIRSDGTGKGVQVSSITASDAGDIEVKYSDTSANRTAGVSVAVVNASASAGPYGVENQYGFGSGLVFRSQCYDGSYNNGARIRNEIWDNSSSSVGSALVFETTATRGGALTPRLLITPSGAVRPAADNSQSLGTSAYRWSVVYAGTGTINTSDGTQKTVRGELTDAELRAWARVNWKIFQFNESIEQKGSSARLHAGLVAQDVDAAFAAEGLDARHYALFCEDEIIEMVQAGEADDGTPVFERVSRGFRKGLRYDQCQAFEAAYQRHRMAALEATIAALTQS